MSDGDGVLAHAREREREKVHTAPLLRAAARASHCPTQKKEGKCGLCVGEGAAASACCASARVNRVQRATASIAAAAPKKLRWLETACLFFATRESPIALLLLLLL